jgi:hypothetical protein
VTDAECIEHTAQLLHAACRDAGAWVSGDNRIAEETCAALLGWTTDALRNRRYEGRGPPHYRLGGSGGRVTYRVSDVATFIETQRCE